jgi:hypothetical protein
MGRYFGAIKFLKTRKKNTDNLWSIGRSLHAFYVEAPHVYCCRTLSLRNIQNTT